MKSMKWWMDNCKNNRMTKLGLLVALLLFVLSGCSLFPTEEVEGEIPVITPPTISKKPEYNVSRGDIEIKVRGQGQVISENEEYLYFKGSEEQTQNGNTGGAQTESFRIKKVYVQPGQEVSAGEVLAELETENLDLEIESKEAQLKIEERKLILELRKEASTEDERLLQEQIKADFRKLQIDYQKLLRKMDNAKIIAPFDGVIANIFYESGSQVPAYEPVMLLMDKGDLIVGVKMSTTDQKLITIGQEAMVTINGVSGELPGVITQLPNPNINNNNNNGGGYYPPYQQKPNRYDERDQYVFIEVEALPEGINRGTVASVSVVVQKKEDVIKVPLSTLRTYMGRNYVVVSENGENREVDVELGLQSATEIEIISGLKEGQKVVGR